MDALHVNNMRTENDHPNSSDDDVTKDEMFCVEESKEHEGYALINIRMDYQHRGIALSHMCLYDYVSTIYRKKSDANDRSYFDAIENDGKISVRLVELYGYVRLPVFLVEFYWTPKERTIHVR